MLEKYLKFLKSDKSAPVKKQEKPIENVATEKDKAPLIPPLNPPVQVGRKIVDTQDVSPETIVTDVMEIETNGERAQGSQTLQRFLGHQPILDASHRVIGYELKLQNKRALPPTDAANTIQKMQDEMLIISVIDLDFQKALGNKLTFINLSPATLFNPLIEQLPKEKVCVAIHLEPGAPQPLFERCQELVKQGIPLALEDFEYVPQLDAFLKLSKYVRIDTRQYDALMLSEQIGKMKKVASPLFIAKNVETNDAFDAYKNLSFNSFQGYYFTKLQPDSPQRLDSNRIRVMEMLNMVMNHAEISELEQKVKLDAALSVKLLKYINCPANGLQQTIRSIGHALVLLGYDQLYRWLTLLMFTTGKADERSRALLKSALIRARFTETLGQRKLPPKDHGGLFIVGIFSVLDALLNAPMEQAMSKLNLPTPVVDAIMNRQGIYAPYLQLAIACENFDQEAIEQQAEACGFSADEVNLVHVKSLIWAEELEN
ncbi:EAL and HDOD domain-containing protein [Sulfurirhabdus autotrophica]|uniref:EAL and modified HD-GYP domain-containing signal transduction protein n=1 Tax=Sulfurirhabdus autotrophica TaxID=1706046 RepID=A0A4R3XUA0_9PROT|nr:HDOD domain-containing protein [Sulfurirhabdus autotrophica]TCV79017.1 EAL and modified HD-GYP domain-containing signal transduction protein [Sulfurirhabdus autotrophica]